MKRRRVARDKKTKVPKKYLTGLSRSQKDKRAKLLKRMAKLYKSGATIPRSMFKARVR
tara:strand:+ start:267 stop:440 length:174 start_codon:yes stop_codon:yes gene_type:complete